LAQKLDQPDAGLDLDDEEDEQRENSSKSAAAQALTAAQREAIAGPGRLVALQVCIVSPLHTSLCIERRPRGMAAVLLLHINAELLLMF